MSEVRMHPVADAQGRYPAVIYVQASLAQQMAREREAVGLTREQLAELSGVALSIIESMEAGKMIPSIRTVKRLSAAIETRKGWPG